MTHTVLYTTGPQDSRLIHLPNPTKFKITEGQSKYQPKLGRGPHCQMASVLFITVPKEVRCTAYHDVSSNDLRIHTDRFNKEGLQQGQKKKGGQGQDHRTVSDLHFLPGCPSPCTCSHADQAGVSCS